MTPETRKRYIDAGIGTKTDTDVAHALDVSREAVRQIRVLLGLPKWRDLKMETRELAVMMLARKGMSGTEIDRHLHLHIGAASYSASRIGGKLAIKRVSMTKHTYSEVVSALGRSKSISEAASIIGIHREYMSALIKKWRLREIMTIPDGRHASKRKQNRGST